MPIRGNNMNKLKLYLSGCIKNINEEFQAWRDKCLLYSVKGFYPNLKFVDPNCYFNYTDKPPKTDKQCKDLFMWLLDQCDLLLLNLDHSDKSVGTGMEVEHALCHGIPIIAFGSKPETWYKWDEISSSVIFDNLDEALDYINDSYVI